MELAMTPRVMAQTPSAVVTTIPQAKTVSAQPAGPAAWRRVRNRETKSRNSGQARSKVYIEKTKPLRLPLSAHQVSSSWSETPRCGSTEATLRKIRTAQAIPAVAPSLSARRIDRGIARLLPGSGRCRSPPSPVCGGVRKSTSERAPVASSGLALRRRVGAGATIAAVVATWGFAAACFAVMVVLDLRLADAGRSDLQQ